MTGNLLMSGLLNAALATLLAVLVWGLTRVWRNPHVAAVLWLVVLLKLVTPPVVPLPVSVSGPWPADRTAASDGAAAGPEDREGDSRSAIGARHDRRTDDRRTHRRDADGDRDDDRIGDRRNARSSEPDEASLATTNAGAEKRPIESMPIAPGPLAVSDAGDAFASRPDAERLEPVLGDERPAADAAVPVPQVPQAGQHPPARTASLPVVLLIAWMAGALLAAAITGRRIRRFRRLLRSVAKRDDDVERAAQEVARRLGLRRCPAVRLVPGSVGPMVWAGAWRAVVLVPRPLWEALPADERETLLAHELAHVARRDHWVRRFEAVVLSVYWWLPTAWLAVRARERAAESCCDAAVLAAYPDRPRAYAEALFAAVSFLSTDRVPALASRLGRPAELKERFAMIIQERIPRPPARWARLGLFAAACLMLAVSVRFVAAVEESPSPPRASEPRSPLGTVGAEEGAVLGAAEAALDFADDDRPGGRPAGASRSGGAGAGEQGADLSEAVDEDFFRFFEEDPGAEPPRVSREVRAQMVRSLIAVIEDPDEPADVKVHALRSLGRVGRGFDEAEQALRRQAEREVTGPEGMALAEALTSLGLPVGVEILWGVLESTPTAELRVSREITRRLDAAEAVPPTAESAAALAAVAIQEWAVGVGSGPMGGGAAPQMGMGQMGMGQMGMGQMGMGQMGMGQMGMGQGGMGQGGMGPVMGMMSGHPGLAAMRLLARLRSSGEGIRRLVDAVGVATEMRIEEGWDATVQDMAARRFGTKAPVRSLLLDEIRHVEPASDEIALALIHALSHKDPEVRQAAAQALGDGQAQADRLGDPAFRQFSPWPASARSSRRGQAVPTRSRSDDAPSEVLEPSEAREPDGPTDSTPTDDAPATAPSATPRSRGIPGAGFPGEPGGFFGPMAGQPVEDGHSLSPEVRARMVRSLIAAADKTDLPAETKTATLRSLGRIGRGSEEAERALLAVAEQATEPSVRLAAVAALRELGSPDGTKLLWDTLRTADEAPLLAQAVEELLRSGAVPSRVEDVRRLALLVGRGQRVSAGRSALARGRGGPPPAREVLARLTESGDGVRLLVETLATTREPLEELPYSVKLLDQRERPQGSTFTYEEERPDQPEPTELAEWIASIYGTKTPIRDTLLSLLESIQPTRDDVALALVEALSNEDPEISRAATRALGNVPAGE